MDFFLKVINFYIVEKSELIKKVRLLEIKSKKHIQINTP